MNEAIDQKWNVINAHGYCDDTSFDIIEKCAARFWCLYISFCPFRTLALTLISFLLCAHALSACTQRKKKSSRNSNR